MNILLQISPTITPIASPIVQASPDASMFQNLINLVLAIIATIVGTLAVMYIWKVLSGPSTVTAEARLIIRPIERADDVAIIGIIELYSKLFSSRSSDYEPKEIRDLLARKFAPDWNPPVVVEDFALVAEVDGNVVGFIFAHYYPERRKAIIPYFGIDKEVTAARLSAADKLLKAAKGLLTTGGRDCEYLFFDVRSPTGKIDAREKRERISRITVFQQSAASLGLKAYKLNFDYVAPRVTLERGTRETHLVLMVVPFDPTPLRRIARDKLEEFLTFIYMDCYGDVYDDDDPSCKTYREYLARSLSEHIDQLPKDIKVSSTRY